MQIRQALTLSWLISGATVARMTPCYIPVVYPLTSTLGALGRKRLPPPLVDTGSLRSLHMPTNQKLRDGVSLYRYLDPCRPLSTTRRGHISADYFRTKLT